MDRWRRDRLAPILVAADSDVVAGIGPTIGVSAAVSSSGRAPQDLPELSGLVLASTGAGVPHVSRRNLHAVQIDDSMTSATFIVSWHHPGRPVQMSLLSPSLTVLTPTSMPASTTIGTSSIIMRVAAPEANEWQLRVSGGDVEGRAGYTWGVHGEAPIGVHLSPPTGASGHQVLSVVVDLIDPSHLIKAVRFAGRASTPAVSVADLVVKNRDALERVTSDLKPDTPKIDPILTKLPILDLQLVSQGQPSLFETRLQKLRFTGRTSKKATFEPLAVGTSAVDVKVSGTTTGGFPFTRVARCHVYA